MGQNVEGFFGKGPSRPQPSNTGILERVISREEFRLRFLRAMENKQKSGALVDIRVRGVKHNVVELAVRDCHGNDIQDQDLGVHLRLATGGQHVPPVSSNYIPVWVREVDLKNEAVLFELLPGYIRAWCKKKGAKCHCIRFRGDCAVFKKPPYRYTLRRAKNGRWYGDGVKRT